MRKILAVLMVVVMMAPALCVAEEESRSAYYGGVQKYTVLMLQMLDEVYKEGPENFGDDLIFMAYGYCMEYWALRRVLEVERDVEYVQKLGKAIFRDESLNFDGQESGWLAIEQLLMKKYSAWLNKETDSAEYAEYLMNSIEKLVLDTDE